MFRVAVLQFPGTNCEYETRRSLQNAGLTAEFVRWNQRDQLADYDAYVLPGGFAYEDRSRAGIIAAQDPVLQIIKDQANQGKPVIGICNGCQILVETGLIPGVHGGALGEVLAGAVAMNTRVKGGKIIGTGFYHDTVYLNNVAQANRSCVTMNMQPGTVIPASVANGEGRFIFDNELLLELEKHDQILFKFCTADGTVLNEFPTTPNGATWGIAGLCNQAGNVVAYMPHPERMDTGIPLFTSLRQWLEQPPHYEAYTIDWKPPESVVEKYVPDPTVLQMFVDLNITDNAAKTIELTLRQRGFNVSVTRQTHWEIWHATQANTMNSSADQPVEEPVQESVKEPTQELVEQLVQSGELLNINKERYTLQAHQTGVAAIDDMAIDGTAPNGTISFLVRYEDDYEGKAVTSTLQDRFQMHAIENVRKGVVWNVHIVADNPEERLHTAMQILQTYIVYNPYAQECLLIA